MQIRFNLFLKWFFFIQKIDQSLPDSKYNKQPIDFIRLFRNVNDITINSVLSRKHVERIGFDLK